MKSRTSQVGVTFVVALVGALTAIQEAPGATAFWTGVNGGNWSGDGVGGQNWSSDTAIPGTPYTPVNGDGLRFFQNRPYPSSTNDMVGLSVKEISFQGATTDYTLNGNKVTVSGGITYGGGHTLNLPLESDGNLTINGGTEADPMTFNGIISETAANSGLYIYSGVVHLNAANTISGLFSMGIQSPPTVYINTLANSGVAQSLGAGTQVKFGHNDNGGTIIYTGSSDVSTDKLAQPGREGGYTGSGTFLNNGTGTVTWNGDFTGISAGVVSRTWTLGGANTGDNTWAGLIRDYDTSAPITDIMGLAKTNAGKWILSGNNTYSGPTTVSEGTLVIDGDQSGATGVVSVASGAILGGTGSIGGSVSVPSGATLAVEVDGASADELTITGTLTLAGNLNITHASAPAASEYRVATASLIDITGVTVTGETRWVPELRNGAAELWIVGPPAGFVLIVR
jgi:autotransporter-associated beta strand protein